MSNIDEIHKAGRNPPVKGVTVEMGGLEWRIAPLTLRQIDAFQEARKQANGKDGKTDEKKIFRANIDAIQGALSRNYPGIGTEDVLDLVDAGNFQAVLDAVMGASQITEGNPKAANPSALTD